MKLKTILIDDEPNAVELLSLRLTEHCPNVEIVARCTSSKQAIEAINRLKPNLVFLDIEMPTLNGFQILEAIEEVDFALIFVTAYDQFAVRAFRYNALDYLLKPLDTADLVQAVSKVKKNSIVNQWSLNQLQQQYLSPSLPERIALPYQNGVIFAPVKDILYCESDNNYTRFFLINGQQHIVLKPLREIQELLEERDFIRIHRQFLVNINFIKKFVRGEGNYIIMDDEKSIPVARAQKEKLREKVGWL